MIFSCISNRARQLLCLLLITMSSAAAWGNLTVTRTSVELNDSKSRDQVRFIAELTSPRQFYITVSAPVYGDSTETDLFQMRPEQLRLGGSVSFAMEIPFHEQKQNTQRRKDSPNRVRNNYRHSASGQFSLCPTPAHISEVTRVCKPLTFFIIDDETAIPGVTYSTRLNLLLEFDSGEQYFENIELKYRKKGSPISIASRKRNLLLDDTTNFSDSVDFCVFSPVYPDFDIKVDGQWAQQGNFLLNSARGDKMPYQVSLQLNQTPARVPVKPDQWISGGQTIIARNRNECRGNSNLSLNAHLERSDINNAKPGIYQDVLTVRVKAK